LLFIDEETGRINFVAILICYLFPVGIAALYYFMMENGFTDDSDIP
jgi:hypothetical protein